MGGKLNDKLKKVVDITKDSMYLSSQIEIISNRELTIQGSKGIIEYNDDSIRINLNEQQVQIYGMALSIKSLSQDTLEIKGKISRLEFI